MIDYSISIIPEYKLLFDPKLSLFIRMVRLLDSSVVLNKVADVNLWWFPSWQIGRCVLIAVNHSVRLPTRHDVHIQQQSMGNCVQMCRPTTHTHMHTLSFTMNRAFIYRPPDWGDVVATEMASQRSSSPATRDHSHGGDVTMNHLISLLWRSSTWPWIMENHSWITHNPTEKNDRGSRLQSLKRNNRGNPDGKRHSWVYEGAQLGLCIICQCRQCSWRNHLPLFYYSEKRWFNNNISWIYVFFLVPLALANIVWTALCPKKTLENSEEFPFYFYIFF